jgi:hypothetical protein
MFVVYMKTLRSVGKSGSCLRSMAVISKEYPVVDFSDELAVLVMLVLYNQCCLSC